MKALTIPLLLYTFGNLIDNAVTHIVQYSTDGGSKWTKFPNNKLPLEHEMHKLGYRYADDTETWDTLRYARTRHLPLTTVFTDANNMKWKVTLERNSDHVSFVVPISRELIFNGDERDRVGVDSKCRFASVSFYYQYRSWTNSHGIRVKTRGLVNPSDGSTSNMGYWKEAIGVAGEAVNVASNFVDIVVKVASLKGGKGKKKDFTMHDMDMDMDMDMKKKDSTTMHDMEILPKYLEEEFFD